MTRSRPTIFFALVLLVILTPPSYGETWLPPSHPKVKDALTIYDRLVRTIGDSRMPPDLRMVAGKASNFDVALYSPSRRIIYVEEEFYDLVQSALPSSSSHGLALILGHELAHFYRNHAWAEDFNRAFARRQTAPPEQGTAPAGPVPPETASERRRLEAEADYFAGFYGYLAGLPTVSVASQLFDSIYLHYHYDPALPAYEHLRQRKDTAREAQQKLRALIPLFEAGVQSLLIQDYESAGRIFTRVAADFPSPEVLSNAAVADLLAALQGESETDRRFIYPVEIDPDTRLNGETTRGQLDLTPEERLARRHMLLERARRTLEQATRMHPSYAAAQLNLACVLDLLGDYESAATAAGQALLLSRAQHLPVSMAHARNIAGIILAHQGHVDESIREWQQAADMGDRTAAHNLAARRAATEGDEGIAPAPPSPPDQVNGLNIGDITANDFLQAANVRILGRWDEDVDGTPPLTVQMIEKADTRVTALVRGAGPTRSVVFFASTGRGAAGETIRGVRTGQPAEAVEQAYGAPTSTLNLPRGRYVGYHSAVGEGEVGVIFRYNEDQTVQEWVAYRIERD